MSFQAMAWASKQTVGNASAKCVLLALANYADDEGSCFPSQEQLASDCECSVRTVHRVISDFERRGIVRRERRYREGGYRTSDRLFLVMENTPKEAEILPDTKSPDKKSPDNLSNLTGHSVIAEPVIEPISSFSNARENVPKLFDEFWASYPHKVGKAAGRKAFISALKRTDFEALMMGLRRYITSKPHDRPWCNPSTWLNQDRWEDEPAPEIQQRSHAPPRATPHTELNDAFDRLPTFEDDHEQRSQRKFEGPVEYLSPAKRAIG